MNTTIELLKANPKVSGYKINVHAKESCELFFVKGKLETLRRTDTCDREVTVYVDHGDYKGEAQFFIYPSTTQEEQKALIQEAVEKALLIDNPSYSLPDGGQGDYTVESNFSEYPPAQLAELIAEEVFAANTVAKASLNSVEIFVERHTETVLNSLGLRKTQVRHSAMVEAIPTYNGEKESVELYQQFSFGQFDRDFLRREIGGKLLEVKARYEAVKPGHSLSGTVILGKQEIQEFLWEIVHHLNYFSIYSNSGLFRKGDAVQNALTGDAISIRMAGAIPGCVRSAKFDSDGVSLGELDLVTEGQVVNYYGSNRYGQYLKETPTGMLPCMEVKAGTLQPGELAVGPSLEVKSMSGLQVDFYNDYIGGEVRLAYWRKDGEVLPVTGISISGKVSQVLSSIRFSKEVTLAEGYQGPAKALLSGMQIF